MKLKFPKFKPLRAVKFDRFKSPMTGGPVQKRRGVQKTPRKGKRVGWL